MKFIAQDGQIAEGIPLTEEQIAMREQILDFTHETVCGGGIHSSYERRFGTVKCEKVANFFITKFTITPLPGTDMSKEIEITEKENEPEPGTPEPIATVEVSA